MKPKKLILLAVLSGLITTFLFYLFINQSSTASVSETEVIKKVQVVVAREDISINQKITDDQITLKEIPEDQAHSNAVVSMEQVAGYYATSDIKQGEVIMNHRVQLMEEEKEVVSKKIQEGYRAVSVQVDYVTGISNLIQPGDYVDVVLSTLEPVTTDMILERMHVLAVGERMVEQKTDGTEEYYQAVTLELTQEDTVKVIDSSKKGVLQLALYSKSEPIEEVIEVNTPNEKPNETDKAVSAAAKSHVRTAPNMKASVLTIVDKGTVLKVTDEQVTENITWYEVETPDQTKGWISGRIIKFIED
ncbi:pilus assembly protein CpaB [Gracilibacillus ureilyticus]|uniref:Pilus assembly protein CpaB n=1 Tax=Gracilibacillus ureilyticus TaxID=531814 RepID=A0A1H9V4Y4_9BACI|nr:Flp pilus assembly protein CpaB [Gracilibacillus ureilyticus]SES16648.1 pilus assembly protein CpaB [Gracilibacillus ureilyticus]